MRRLMVLLALIGLPIAAHAEWKKVTRQESKLLLDAPLIENGREVYQYGGWSASGGYESSFAAILPAKGAYPQMQVYLHRMASLHQWSSGSDLDEKWLKKSFSFLKDKAIRITAAPPQPGRYLRVVRLTVDQSDCAGFEMRQIDINNSIKSDSERNSVSALYCAPTGVALSDDVVRQATEGIYWRNDSGVERVLTGVSRPVPARLK